MFRPMVRVPQLGDNEKVFTCADTFSKGTCNALTNLNLVAVIASTIQQAISALDSFINSIGCNIFGDLPQTEANLR